MRTRELAKRLASRELKAEVVAGEFLQHIDAREDDIGAWAHLDREGVMATARELDRGANRGLPHGLPIGVKDIIDVAALPARYGTPIYHDHIAPWDAACVSLRRAAGATVMGKAVTTELAWFHPGKTHNPHHLAHTPGGSSSGSAAAVAAGMVPLAFGTQTAGSVIRPAAYCGVAGFKPTFGLVPRAGVKSQAESLDTIGWMASDVDGLALLAATMLGDGRFGDEATPGSPRIGVVQLPEASQASVDMSRAIEQAANLMGTAGASVVAVSLPVSFQGLNQAQHDIQLFEASRSYFSEYSQHRQQLSARIVSLLEEGRGIGWDRYRAALNLAAACRAMTTELFREIDVWLLPTAPGAAPAGLAATGDPVFNRASTVLHLPAVTLPHFRDTAGLPLGIQLLGPAGADLAVIRAARWTEAVLGRH